MNEAGTALESAGHIGYPEAIIKAFESIPVSGQQDQRSYTYGPARLD